MAIDWAPKTTLDEVVQNVRTLLATETGSVPLARAMGTPQDAVDDPENVAGARLRAAVIRAVRAYEPRVKASSVKLAPAADGRLDVTVELDAP